MEIIITFIIEKMTFDGEINEEFDEIEREKYIFERDTNSKKRKCSNSICSEKFNKKR